MVNSQNRVAFRHSTKIRVYIIRLFLRSLELRYKIKHLKSISNIMLIQNVTDFLFGKHYPNSRHQALNQMIGQKQRVLSGQTFPFGNVDTRQLKMSTRRLSGKKNKGPLSKYFSLGPAFTVCSRPFDLPLWCHHSQTIKQEI